METEDQSRCDQCDTTAPLTPYPPYGLLCDRCVFRQNEHDERRDTFAALSARDLGFVSEDE